ncbi:MAG: hypothetical protein JW936_03025 [Sedimentisphaerales bacterium]|nr:hypothetical protein [Sedimentisphaerales bacterium]
MANLRKSFWYSVVMVLVSAVVGWAQPCVLPDNGTGTITLPPIGCEFTSPDEAFMIIDGLPAGTTIEMPGIWQDFICCDPPCYLCSVPLLPGDCEGDGGSLGGRFHCFESTLQLSVVGTGALAGYTRTLYVPVMCEVHTAPRILGDPVQSFQTCVFRLFGELLGDPDFCTFRITAGNDFGLPSPGQTVLTELPSGDFAVDSFFDITYQIEFEGCPGSPLDGYMGTTTATIRMQTEGLTLCAPLPNGLACNPEACVELDQQCMPTAVNYDPVTGDVVVTDCDCGDAGGCHVDATILSDCPNPCVLPDNGSGTATLPPIGCNYLSPYEVFMIINGLPPGTTLEMPGVWGDFLCCAPSCPVCSMPLSPGQCEGVGGTLGGNFECFESTLALQVHGTGDLAGYNRTLYIPVGCEVHTAPRTPGDPVQKFDALIYRLEGELFGDPDFCAFRIRAGSYHSLPCPGETTLTQLPSGDFAVDSFFDITYEIEFEGCPGSPLDGYMGTTTGTILMETGCGFEPPVCTGGCGEDYVCYQEETVLPDGTIDISCNCVEPYVIQAGFDYWATPRAEMDFLNDPLPSDFFGPGSDPFEGQVCMTGSPVDPDNALADTIVERLDDVTFNAPIGTELVDIELVALNLVSTEPITVTFDTGPAKLYDVTLTLHTAGSSAGQMTINRTHSQGGTFDFSVDAWVLFTFQDRLGSPGIHRVLPFTLTTTELYPWQSTPPILTVRPACVDGDFYPSGQDSLRLSPGVLAGFHDVTHEDPLPMDFDDDRDVDLADFAVFASQWLYGR